MNRSDKLSIDPHNERLRTVLSDIDELPFLAIESDGSPFPQIITAKLEALFEDREEEVNALLVKAGRIQDGQTFRDLTDAHASKYIAKPDLILSKLPVIVSPEVIETEVSNG